MLSHWISPVVKSVLWLWLAANSGHIFAAGVAQVTQHKSLLLSYTSHPEVEQVFIPLLRQAYHNLGYQVRFVNVQSDRFPQLVQQQQVDGDVARLSQMSELAGVTLEVYKLADINLSLLCRPHLPCDKSMLYQPIELIYTPANSQIYQYLQLNFHARLATSRDWQQLLQLYQQGKIDRLIWVGSTDKLPDDLKQTRQVSILDKPLSVFHILHKSRAALVPQIQAELERLMQTRQQKPRSQAGT